MTVPVAKLSAAVALVLLSLSPASASASVPIRPDSTTRELIVARAPNLAASERQRVRVDAGVKHLRNLRLPNTELVSVPASRLAATLAELNANPDVRFAEPNTPVYAHSDDPSWATQWALENTGQTVNGNRGTPDADIDAPAAWAHSTGTGQSIAVVDTGTTFGHQDLQGQLAGNPGETGGGKETDGVDDDRNGLVDDYRGWDFVQNDNDPSDGHSHGTHVTGIIAAAKDNRLGIAGVAPNAKVLPLRALADNGSGTSSDIAEAFDLAGDLGIGVVNASLGGVGSLSGWGVVARAIEAHPQTIYVISAGNGGSDDVGDDNDTTPTYPCALPAANIICVGATGFNDERTDFSNYGAKSVDLFAPGRSIRGPAMACVSCYQYRLGTSAAAPQVAATVALMRTANPALDAAALKAAVLGSVDVREDLEGTSVTDGRLNSNQAVIAGGGAIDPPDPCATVPPDPDCEPVDPVDPTGPVVDPGGTPAPGAGGPTLGFGSGTAAPPAGESLAAGGLRLGKPSLSRSKLTRRKSARLKFTLSRAAAVRLTVRRRSGRRVMRAVTVRAVAGANRYTLRTRRGKRTLRRGRYQLKVVALDGKLRSRAYTLRFSVRRGLASRSRGD